ncbi:MAG: hypothetical protein L3J67_07705 [Hyphomicrobiaceae bacterium]|nr:hypothetical protein [Hyphomicrobiaceae bacterium]
MSVQKKKTYYKNGDGFVLNVYYKDGEPVELFEKQAKYQLAPLGTELRLEEKASVKTPAPAAAKDKTTNTTTKQAVK